MTARAVMISRVTASGAGCVASSFCLIFSLGLRK